ncbi:MULTISPECIES: AraC family transcriptional regulator [Flavobacterium]|uniref:Helix-turn-helix domain-containing protein n=1 Tax=Flavobacterium endoglycinae TaxID=2816357 RepID=A0ABX7QCP3_9FLAO|nr:AraC family transcriptional regulator [Flavobacterium endoglycinae]QSW88820.1 helix-turn-helix domain-containing protein [Flavobacterium endoglycinae]
MEEIFKIFKINIAESDKIQRSVNEPHYHDFEELIIGKEGRLEHFIDFQSHLIDAPFISFVTRGKVHRAKPLPKDGKCDMWVLRFKSEFVAESAFQLYASFHENANVEMPEHNCFGRLATICEIIYDEYQQERPDLAVIRQLLSALFTIIESERRKLNLNNEESKKIQGSTFRNFLRLLEEYYKQPKDVHFYAEKLFMTVRNLNNICQNILQQSVSEIIETRKLTEAKNLLITTDKTISEIGFELGFKEKTYFTHAFKKKSGMTPTEFRDDMSKLIS